MIVFGQIGCFRAKVDVFGSMVVLGQKWLYSDKSGCILENCSKWAKVVVFGQSGF